MRRALRLWRDKVARSRYDNAAVHMMLRTRAKRGRAVMFMHWRMLCRHQAFLRAYRNLRVRALVQRWRRQSLCWAFRTWTSGIADLGAPSVSTNAWLLVLRSSMRSFQRRSMHRAWARWRLATVPPVVVQPSPAPLASPATMAPPAHSEGPAILETGFGVFERRVAATDGVTCRSCIGGTFLFFATVLLLAFLLLKLISRYNPDAYWNFACRGGCSVWAWMPDAGSDL